VVQFWSRNTPESGPNETFVLNRRVGGGVWTGTGRVSCDQGLSRGPIQGYLAHKKQPFRSGLGGLTGAIFALSAAQKRGSWLWVEGTAS